jgi:hypothetical protein
VLESRRPRYSSFLELQVLGWFYAGEGKVESVEELACLLILWP